MKRGRYFDSRNEHAFLSPSKYSWINYDADKIADAYYKFLAVKRGTELHEFAAKCIELGQKLPRSRKTLNMYVNDAISFGMKPEQLLYYSENCYGTADSIIFKNRLLRIHDFKSGETPAHMEQLEIYAALFCLQEDVDPGDIDFELRIYQSNDIVYFNPTVIEIAPIMDKIIHFDEVINGIKEDMEI